ncbi:3-hydroxyacyl-ACP dehydratase FabZ family protein [Bremerella sp. JC817]|uniref:3-hydroxyacyl-ACP dehydratase FabZ family protein n=1 Tax=Bremerella sp. JC817 TaxID=3231756 RepID=UPI003457F618
MTKVIIEDAIPHRGPMLLVDEVVEQTEDQIICRKTFTPDEYFFQGHYPDYPLVPGVILCEATMQAGAILLSKFVTEGGGVPVATRLNDVKFKKMVRPGDLIEMIVKLNERMADAFFMTGKVTVGGKLAMRFDFACTVAQIEES